MKKFVIALLSCGVVAAASAALAQTAPSAPAPAAPAAAAAATAPAYYTAEETTIGDLLDNPATKAILTKHIPSIVNNEGIDRARSMTLVAIQPYSNDAVTDEKLKAIDEDLAKIPAPKT